MKKQPHKPKRGGKRAPGPGKTLGRPPGTGKGRTVVSRTVAMPEPSWDAIDDLRGSVARGVFIRRALDLP